jgi:hypothetical protein
MGNEKSKTQLLERNNNAESGFGGLTTKGLGLAGARILRKHLLDGVCRFHAALLLQFINPIGHGLNHFARRLCGRVSLRHGLLLTNPFILLYDFDSFLF